MTELREIPVRDLWRENIRTGQDRLRWMFNNSGLDKHLTERQIELEGQVKANLGCHLHPGSDVDKELIVSILEKGIQRREGSWLYKQVNISHSVDGGWYVSAKKPGVGERWLRNKEGSERFTDDIELMAAIPEVDQVFRVLYQEKQSKVK